MARATENIKFAKELSAPAVRAQLDVLLLFARSLGGQVIALAEATEAEGGLTWSEGVDILAERIAQQIGKLSRADQARLIWQQFMNDLSVDSLGPRAKDTLERVEGQLEESLELLQGAPTYALNYLMLGNILALDSVARMWNIGDSLRETIGRPLLVRFDPKGEDQHAAAWRDAEHIVWSFQLRKHALWGALVLNRILEHEYFCHVMPVNRSLSTDVREGFLDRVLQLEHAGMPQAGAPTSASIEEGRWSFMLQKFRGELMRHFAEQEGERRWRLRNLAEGMWLKRRDFCRVLTFEILRIEDGNQTAKFVDLVLNDLSLYAEQNRLEEVFARWKELSIRSGDKLLNNIGI